MSQFRSSRPKTPRSLRLRAKPKSRPELGLVIGAVISTGLAVGVAVFVWWRHTAQQEQGFAAIAQIVPREAQVVLAFNTDEQEWQKLGQFGTPASRRVLAQGIAQSPLSLLLKQGKMDFAQDVQPWLGDRLLTALIPMGRSIPATLIIAQTRNPAKSDQFLSKYRDALTMQGANFQEKEYQGFTYWESPSPDANSNIVTASIGGKYIAIATSGELMQRVFDTYRDPQRSLAQTATFRQAIAQPSQIAIPLVQAYLDGSTALQLVSQNPKVSSQKIEAVSASLGLQKEGLRLELDTHLQSTADNVVLSGNRVLALIPDSAFLVVSGSNLAKSWQAIATQIKGNRNAEAVAEQFQKFILDSTGLELEREILPWLSGEFALALLPENLGILANTGFGLALLFQTSDPSLSASALEKLDRHVSATKGGLFPAGIEVKRNPETVVWQVGDTVIASRSVTNQGFVVWTMGELDKQFFPTPTRPLPASDTFRLLTTSLPANNGGYFYLHMTSALGIMERLLPAEVKANPTYGEVRSVLDTIEGIAVTSTPLGDRTARLEMLFTLKPIAPK
jgi:hypothetical protein